MNKELKPTYYFINIVVLLMMMSYPLFLQSQAITQPLFMQIKPPKLESASGILVDSNLNKHIISTNGKDSVNISFTIVVPNEILSEQWAISLTPTIWSTREDGVLKDVVIKGWKFAEAQEEDYEKYDSFINSIVDTSLYEKMYIDQKKLEKEIEERHDQYWRFYYDEWERQVNYEIWKSQQDGSSQIFSLRDRASYREQLYDQYLIRIKNQSDRYIKANMDTTGLHVKYMKEFESHDAKMPRYFVDNNMSLKNVPKIYKDIYESGRTLTDITNSMLDLLVKKDSALMSLLPTLDYKRIIENEKRSMLQDGIYDDLIQLPRNKDAVLDTVVYNTRVDYRYLYTYSYPVLENQNDTIKVKLATKILATDRSGFSTNSEETLTYIVKNDLSKEETAVTATHDLTEYEDNVEYNSTTDDSSDAERMSIERLTEKLFQLANSKEDKIISPAVETKKSDTRQQQRAFGSRIQVIE